MDQLKTDKLRTVALDYHERGRRGKIEVVPTKPCLTQYDLSLAYTPGVAQPCLEIFHDRHKAHNYTAKGNLVAVVSNGTAVLGLGNIGALAGKPVMEGKGVLFKRFADIDVFDIELDTEDPDDIIKAVTLMAPTFGGINLEDIKAPECFYIEETLKRNLDIPVFHDDQHGTAIISGAALLNALELTGKAIEDVKVVFSGAGAAGIACANFYISLGVTAENVLMTDSKGVLWKGRGDEGRNKYKDVYYRDTPARTLADAMAGADVFAGLSLKGLLTKEMVSTMADRPIIFAMANPDPEITFDDAREARPDCIVATGRSDYPNQVNNVLGFPFIFRGTLDVEATSINEEMKKAAAFSLAKLAKEDVPESVRRAYGDSELEFGPDYIIPKPFDPRVLVWESLAVAEAAMKTGVARKMVDLDEYREQLVEKIDWSREMMRKVYTLARRAKKRIVFPEGRNPNVIWAASEIAKEGIAIPVVLGKKDDIIRSFEQHHHTLDGIEIVNPKTFSQTQAFEEAYYALRQRDGVTRTRASLDMRDPFYFGSMMVRQGVADGMVAGATANFQEVLAPARSIIGPRPGGKVVAGMYMLLHEHQLYVLADCAVNVNPTAVDLAEIALLSAHELERLHIKPRIALLSYANFGSRKSKSTKRVADAVGLIKASRPDLMVDGPMQADFALDPDLLKEHFPFSDLKNRPNLLVFPNLEAGNISMRLLRKFGNAHVIGPIIVGLDKPVHVLTRGAEVNTIVNLAAIAAVDAQQEPGTEPALHSELMEVLHAN